MIMDTRNVAMAHLAFAVVPCLVQVAGREFMIEQPVGASLRGAQLMTKLLVVKGAGQVLFEFCMFERKSVDGHVGGHAKNGSSTLSKSQALLTEFRKHSNTPGLEGRVMPGVH